MERWEPAARSQWLARMNISTSPAEAFGFACRHLANGNAAESETILRRLASQFPDKLEYGEALLDALAQQQKFGEMLAHFRGMVDRFNPTEDPVYDGIYVDALRATSNSAAPLRRMLRFYELVRQLQRAVAVKGDVAECGCFRGMSSYLLCSYLARHDPSFDGTGYHIFDSFQGLAQPSIDDEIPPDHKDSARLRQMSCQGTFAASFATVRRNLASFPRIEYHPGWIPLTFKGLPERTYRFVHVDVDHYDPTWDCLDYFYPRLAAGGILISDDYSWPGARKAIEEFCAERDLQLTVTAYDQAILRQEI